jgi:hypothetical protein
MTRIDSVVQSVDVEGRAGGVMIFYTCPPVTGSLTERMRITESGFVGIGISVPATTLHVGNSDVTDAGLALTSQRVAIAVDNVLNGVDFHSNDTNLSISTLTAYIRAYASETHTATTLGSRITFATTAIGAAAPTLRMTLMDTGVLSMGTWTGQKINLYDSTVNKYGLGIGSSQLQIYSPNAATTRTEIGGMSNTDGVTFIPVLRVLPSSTSMVLGPVGATAVGTSGTYVFGISTGTRATTSPTAMVQMWTEDQDGANTAALHVRSEGNWITKIGQGIITRAAYLTLTTYTTAAPYSPVALEESNRTFLASNTSAMTQVSLPAAAVGYVFKFIVTAAQGLRIRAFTGDTIRIGSTVTAAAGYIQSTTLGDYIELFATSSGGWYARSPIQGWTIGV